MKFEKNNTRPQDGESRRSGLRRGENHEKAGSIGKFRRPGSRNFRPTSGSGLLCFFFSSIRWKLSRRTSSPLPPSGLLRFTFFALPFPIRPPPHPCFWHCLCLFVCQFAVFRVWFGFSVFLLRHAPVQAAAGSGHPRAPPSSEPSSDLNCRYAIRFSGGNSGNILLKIQHRQFS